MSQYDELKTSLTNQGKAMTDYLAQAEDKLNTLAEKAEGAFKDEVMAIHADVARAKEHFSAYDNTARVAADAQPPRMGGAAPAGVATADTLPGGGPVALSGVPVTPPAAPATGLGPAVPHVDIGQRTIDGETHDAPAAIDPQAEPVVDPTPVVDAGAEVNEGDAAKRNDAEKSADAQRERETKRV